MRCRVCLTHLSGSVLPYLENVQDGTLRPEAGLTTTTHLTAPYCLISSQGRALTPRPGGKEGGHWSHLRTECFLQSGSEQSSRSWMVGRAPKLKQASRRGAGGCRAGPRNARVKTKEWGGGEVVLGNSSPSLGPGQLQNLQSQYEAAPTVGKLRQQGTSRQQWYLTTLIPKHRG